MTSVTELDMRPVEEVLAKYAEVFADEADRQIWLEWTNEFLGLACRPHALLPLLEPDVRPGIRLRAYLTLFHVLPDNELLGIDPRVLERVRNYTAIIREFRGLDEWLRRFGYELAHATVQVLPNDDLDGQDKELNIPLPMYYTATFVDICGEVLQMDDLADLHDDALAIYMQHWEYADDLMAKPIRLELKGRVLTNFELLIAACAEAERPELVRMFLDTINHFALEECLHTLDAPPNAAAEEMLVRAVERFMQYPSDQACRDLLLQGHQVHILDWLPSGPREAFGIWLFGGELRYARHNGELMSFSGYEYYASEFANSSPAATRNFAAWQAHKLAKDVEAEERAASFQADTDRRMEIMAAVKLPVADS